MSRASRWLPAALLLGALLSVAVSEPLTHAHGGLADPHDCPGCRWENASSCEPAVVALVPIPYLLPGDAVRALGGAPLPPRTPALAPARAPPAA